MGAGDEAGATTIRFFRADSNPQGKRMEGLPDAALYPAASCTAIALLDRGSATDDRDMLVERRIQVSEVAS